jgi:hypothetical protein
MQVFLGLLDVGYTKRSKRLQKLAERTLIRDPGANHETSKAKQENVAARSFAIIRWFGGWRRPGCESFRSR